MMVNLFKLNKFYLSILFGCFCPIVFSQTTEEFQKFKAKYPNENAIVLKNELTVKISMVNGQPKITKSLTFDLLILDNTTAASLAEGDVEFSSFNTIKEIEAYSLVPSGSKSKKIKASNFQTKDAETEGSVFHDDGKITTFIYSGLTEGSVRHLHYVSEEKNNEFPFAYYFFSSIPNESMAFTIECDNAVDLKIYEPFIKENGINFKKDVVKNTTIYSWQANKAFEIKKEHNRPDETYFSPHILVNIASYTVAGKQTNVISNLDDLHRSYEKNIQEVINEKPTAEMKTLAESIIVGKTTEFDKVKAIYYWVQSNIKYIAFEEGTAGFIPRQPNKILAKRYGDCKDMASLIYALTKAVNIPTYLTWIGSRDIPYKYSEIPTSFCDNHMIATYYHNGNPVFLDATSSFLPISIPSAFTQGKECLIHLSEGKYDLKSVPIPTKEQTSFTDYSTVRIEGKTLIGHSESEVSGYYFMFIGDAARSLKKSDELEFLSSVNEKGNNSFVVEKGKLTNMTNRDSIGKMSYDWKVTNYVSSVGNEIYVNLLLAKDFVKYPEIEKDRISPLDMISYFDDKYITTLEIPEGYTCKSLPKNRTITSEHFGYSVTYEQKNNQVICTLRFYTEFLLLDKSEFENWNKFIKDKKGALSESVVLIKK
ncbi:MAG: transglutaminase-like domain-containing protein [Fluviicola sp.]